MESLRVKFKTTDIELEIEGKESVVLNLIKKLDTSSLENLSNRLSKSTLSTRQVSPGNLPNTEIAEFSLNDFYIRNTDMPQNELMVVASTKLGRKFSKRELRELMKAECGMDSNRSKNFSADLRRTIRKKYLASQGGEFYSLTVQGHKFAEKSLAGE